MGRVLKILIPLAVVLCLSACSSSGGRIIPKRKMAQIYAEMFVADQQVTLDFKTRSSADTSLVYEPIFEKYGYTVEDYRASRAHYIQEPDQYARILRNTVRILEGEVKQLKKEKVLMESMEQIKKNISKYKPERIYFMTGLSSENRFVEDSLAFCVDSTGGSFIFDPQDGMDTAYYGPLLFVRDSVAVPKDTLDSQVDSLVSKSDSLAVKGASLTISDLRPIQDSILSNKVVPLPDSTNVPSRRPMTVRTRKAPHNLQTREKTEK